LKDSRQCQIDKTYGICFDLLGIWLQIGKNKKEKLSLEKIKKTFTVSPIYVLFHDISLYWIFLIKKLAGHGTLGKNKISIKIAEKQQYYLSWKISKLLGFAIFESEFWELLMNGKKGILKESAEILNAAWKFISRLGNKFSHGQPKSVRGPIFC
jgi:hypothetical protein